GPRPGPGRATRRRQSCRLRRIRSSHTLLRGIGCRVQKHHALSSLAASLPDSAAVIVRASGRSSTSQRIIGHCGAAHFTGGDLLDCPLEFALGRRENADPSAGNDAVRLVPVELSQILQRVAICYGDQALRNPDGPPALPAAQTLVHAFARRADQIAELALREPDLRQ